MTKPLDQVYATSGTQATRAFYDAWGRAMSAEVAKNGCATLGRAAFGSGAAPAPRLIYS
ncbi:hypothetical protein KUD11_12450 [Roseovarius sp. LXJ103]|uniref:hypothetical protein n=1 Tax=Roseovarius carneus TaxID=2853164 RepID=UPI001CCCDC87|nr:hypothetical protein [Roseovarius carneus]MBZ8119453.1 hypothetical protein [Roseovarius carneus]